MITGHMHMLFNFSGIEIATGRMGAYFQGYVNTATGRMSFIILGIALLLLLGVYDETATGRVG